jgi:2,3-bisphosphoglycerate-independent phosphoglycerate mutase
MPPHRKHPVALIVLDGWGYRAERDGNAIALASTPTWDRLTARYPRTLLEASGLRVGLPEGQMGNSEVGHLNLGAGRVVTQDIVRISQAISDGSFFRLAPFVEACRRVKASKGTLHLMGLIGNGGVHALDQHLFALIDLAAREQVPAVAIHALLDGRDTLPRSALGFMQTLLERAAGRARVASLGGRYFGMDRDKRWDRTEKWYRAAVMGTGPTGTDPLAVIRDAYARDETDEFIEPHTIVDASGAPVAAMRDGDAMIAFNYRADRMRQIVRALTVDDFSGFATPDLPSVYVVTMTQYDQTFTTPMAFEPRTLANIVAEVVANAGLRQFHTAETEKYAHVTYFFNGGRETPFPHEDRLLVPSPKVATYDLAPGMSAEGVTDSLCGALKGGEHDFILCNYANSDMVGHTGSIPATISAVETVDACLARVLETAGRAGARLLITADHGNCEQMIDPATGGPHTAHTTNPVPVIAVDAGAAESAASAAPLRAGGALCDVGPTILTMLGLDQPSEMTGINLRTADSTP